MDFVISQAILAFITNLKYTVEKSIKNKIPWELWKGALAIRGGAATAMAIVASPSMGDHRNYVHL